MSDPEHVEVLGWGDSPLGSVCLQRRPLNEPGRPAQVTEVKLGDEILMTDLYTASEEALSELAVARHGGQGLSILIGGLGLGYTVRAALRCPSAANVLVVERLAPVIEWLRAGLLPAGAELADPRLEVLEENVFGVLFARPERTWDLVLLDVDHSPDEPLQGFGVFYTPAGLRRAARHLAPGGLLGVWSRSEDPEFEAHLHTVFARVAVERVRWWREETAEGWEDEDVLFFASEPYPKLGGVE